MIPSVLEKIVRHLWRIGETVEGIDQGLEISHHPEGAFFEVS